MEKGKVSFIVVNWNGEKTITECLDSILAQTYKNNEIIFVDNHPAHFQRPMEGKAIEHYEKFLDLWNDADPGIAEVEDAKKRVAVLKQ